MPESERTPAAEIPLTRAEKEKLLQRMYSLPHWIAVVRLFGYEAMHMDKARKQIKPIAEEHGKEPVAAACEALVEIVTDAKEPYARLKNHVRRMAFQILGPPPQATAAPVVSAPPSNHLATPSEPRGATETPNEQARPVRQPRHFVLKQFQTWMNETGLAFVAMKDVQRTTPAVEPFIKGLDFIVLRGDAKLLVTVRPHLQEKHRSALRELQKIFGPEYRGMRIWPAEGPEGWRWQEHPFDSAEAPAEAPKPPEEAPTTPLLQHYKEVKERHPDKLLIFRVGDFYELFDEDAKTAAKLLGLTLSSRDRTIPMAGFPHHQLETYLKKLLQSGQRVAICDHVDEADARRPKPREVQRVVLPGSVVTDADE